MGAYILRRLLQTVLVLLGASVVLFVCLFVVTDPFAVQGGDKRTDPTVRIELEHRYGLDKGLPTQYVRWVSRTARLDFGESFKRRRPVNDIIGEKIFNTMKLAIASIIIEIGIGLGAGLISAIFRYSFWDVLVTLTTTAAIGFPSFVLGLGMQFVLGVRLRWLPLNGTSPEGLFGLDAKILMPALTLAFVDAAVVARLMRGTMLEVLRADYVRTARAKGLSERVVMLKHAMRNAIIPVVTYLGVAFGTLLGGALITENIFNWDGVGKALIQAIYGEDNPVVLGIVTYGVVVFVLLNLVVDVAYGFLDPRIRLGGD